MTTISRFPILPPAVTRRPPPGGSVWELNPPEPPQAPPNGFEDRAGHQTRSAPVPKTIKDDPACFRYDGKVVGFRGAGQAWRIAALSNEGQGYEDQPCAEICRG